MAEKEAVVTDAPEEESEDALAFLEADQEATEEAVSEGDEQPSPDDAGEEAQGEEAATEPDAEIPSEKEGTRERFQELTEKLRRYEKYDPIIQMLEEPTTGPELTRKVVEKRLGLGERTPAPAPAQPSAEEIQGQRARLEKAMQDDPVGTLVYLIREEVKAVNAPNQSVGVKSIIREYKADRRASDDGDLFKHYEPIFDAFLKSADPAVLQADPDTALLAIENIAFGTWAREQRAKVRAGRKGKPAATRDTPRSLERPGAKPVAVAKPRKPLSEEERRIAEIYGEEAVTPDETEESESAWGRM